MPDVTCSRCGQTRAGFERPPIGTAGATGERIAREICQDCWAQWLRQHPEVVVRIEGHGEPNDTRDHALAMGARRAQEVRDYLVLFGVPAAQLSTTSWGKERPGAPRAVTVLVR